MRDLTDVKVMEICLEEMSLGSLDIDKHYDDVKELVDWYTGYDSTRLAIIVQLIRNEIAYGHVEVDELEEV